MFLDKMSVALPLRNEVYQRFPHLDKRGFVNTATILVFAADIQIGSAHENIVG
jgi:hypothetical protein